MVDTITSMQSAALSKLRVVNELISCGNSDIQKYYNNTTIFLTGGTGFLGKQLIEKLLRACNISKIYVLLRSKKGLNIQARLADLLNDTVFETLRQKQPDFGHKIVAVNGDTSNVRLGLNEEDWKTLTNEVDIIFHLAATTRFDEHLKTATLINVRGTVEIITLAKHCKKLRSIVHVSTAYSHATEKLVDSNVDEVFYPSPIAPQTLLSFVENTEESRINDVTPQLIRDWPNTYTFTKAVAEEVVRTMSDGLPICIVRPGIVAASYREPSPGWVDPSNVYGASGVYTGLATGVTHSLLINEKKRLGHVPCDYVNNAIIVAGRETACDQSKGGHDTRIYASISTLRNNKTLGILNGYVFEAREKISSPSAIYYCFALFFKNKIMFNVASFFLHMLPAYFVDSICFLLGKKRQFVKLYSKIHKLSDVLAYFIMNEWKFDDHNLNKLFSNLKEDDKIIFNFDVSTVDWREYMFLWILGVRKYIIKDGLKNTEYALKKQFWLRYIHYVLMTIYCYGIWKFIWLLMRSISVLLGFIFVKLQ